MAFCRSVAWIWSWTAPVQPGIWKTSRPCLPCMGPSPCCSGWQSVQRGLASPQSMLGASLMSSGAQKPPLLAFRVAWSQESAHLTERSEVTDLYLDSCNCQSSSTVSKDMSILLYIKATPKQCKQILNSRNSMNCLGWNVLGSVTYCEMYQIIRWLMKGEIDMWPGRGSKMSKTRGFFFSWNIQNCFKK